MNMKIFSSQVRKAYKAIEGCCNWELSDYLDFFCIFFRLHKYKTGHEHYNIPTERLQDIMENLCFVMDDDGNYIEVYPEDSEAIIRQYFRTYFDCDYSIYHFMSGNIRLYRLYELGL